jgi:mRNA interferase YafQ
MASTRYIVKQTSRYKKDLRKLNRQGRNLEELKAVVRKLADGKPLDLANRDHVLTGEYKGCHECHIRPDWLLIYEFDNDTLYLYLMRTGSHAELFSH